MLELKVILAGWFTHLQIRKSRSKHSRNFPKDIPTFYSCTLFCIFQENKGRVRVICSLDWNFQQIFVALNRKCISSEEEASSAWKKIGKEALSAYQLRCNNSWGWRTNSWNTWVNWFEQSATLHERLVLLQLQWNCTWWKIGKMEEKIPRISKTPSSEYKRKCSPSSRARSSW